MVQTNFSVQRIDPTELENVFRIKLTSQDGKIELTFEIIENLFSFEENAEFFTLTYETSIAIGHNRAFDHVSTLLWMRAGCEGRRIYSLPKSGWDVADTYGLLLDLDQATKFCNAIKISKNMRLAFIVTDDDRRFQSVARRLPESVESVRLYESYLSNFQFSHGG